MPVIRECPSCGERVPPDRITDTACWQRVPLELKRPFWRTREAGEILAWLRTNPPKVKRKSS